ncbi:Na+/H+ antiporter NhaC family protein [Kordiimonas gwangyangensis]|uniref:Na+/H+ antiporter NhaC family protein n=1 Tax=Kordiimonas gwangyangensis TaxID=288022 RepID=UPI00036F73F8|nr:Na+/H+ antiporter NhaC family protein [Kordiimonas gwangyangensis]
MEATEAVQTTLTHSGAISLIPTLLVLIIAVWIKRPIEALLAGAIVGVIMLNGTGAVGAFADIALRTLQDDDLAWIILVCGGMGALIGLFVRTGSLHAFMDKVTSGVKTRFGALMATWLMGVALFVDDYLNSITVGAAMRRITDRFKISREMLAYVIDSTAAPISVIIPISTWAVFFGTILVDVGLAEEGHGVMAYISGIPYMLYPWIAVIMVPLIAAGKIPLFGPMKAAEARAAAGHCIPPGAEHIHKAHLALQEKPMVRKKISLFLLPMLALVGLTIYFDLEFLRATIATLALTVFAVLSLRILDMHDTFDTLIEGFKTMIEPLAIIFSAYMLKDVNGELGLTSYILELTQPFMTAQTLPFIVFGVMGLIAFATGSSWGMFVIALPIIAELAIATDANIPLIIGATLSASTFGSHACLYADATVLTAQSCGCTSIQHALTQLPFAILAALISLIGFAILA